MSSIAYEYNEGLLQKTKNIVKKGIKYSAYGAFLALGTVAALHLYNNNEDRAEFKQGLVEVKDSVMLPINAFAYKLTGHTITETTNKASKFIEQKTSPLIEKTVEKAKEIKSEMPTEEKAQHLGHKIVKATDIVMSGLKEKQPEIEQEVKKDMESSSNDVKGKIRQIRQYSGDLTERLGQKIKP